MRTRGENRGQTRRGFAAGAVGGLVTSLVLPDRLSFAETAAAVPLCDTLIIGGGSAGCVLAARLTEDPAYHVVLLEAGRDFGPRGAGDWPRALLDGADWTDAAEWQYWNVASPQRSAYNLPAGKTIGGSSSINSGGFNWPQRADFNPWPQPEWGFESLSPYLAAVEADPLGPGTRHGRTGPIPVARPNDALSPFFAAFADAALSMDHPWLADLNDPDSPAGISRRVRNTIDGVRFNAAFAYLDPVRARPNLHILPDTAARRVLFQGKRAIGAETGAGTIKARRVILACGAYNSPVLLMRSGIGPADHLRAAGIPVIADLAGVGSHLTDHPVVTAHWRLTEAGSRQASQGRNSGSPAIPWQLVLRTRSPDCVDGGFDVQIAPGGPVSVEDGWVAPVRVEVMRPRSTGTVRLDVAHPDGNPKIDTALLSDPRDLALMTYAMKFAQSLAASSALRDLIVADTQIPDLRGAAYSYHHPSGTCRMGPSADHLSVTGETGGVHGLEGLVVADASIMPSIPRVPLNLLVMAMAGKIAADLRKAG